jgi:hypothetical protein
MTNEVKDGVTKEERMQAFYKGSTPPGYPRDQLQASV